MGPQGLPLPKAEKLRLGSPLVPFPQPTSFSISFSLKYSVSGLKSFDCFHCLVGGGGREAQKRKRRGEGGVWSGEWKG